MTDNKVLEKVYSQISYGVLRLGIGFPSDDMRELIPKVFDELEKWRTGRLILSKDGPVEKGPVYTPTKNLFV